MNEANRNYLNDMKNEHKTIMQILDDIKGSTQKKDIQSITVRMNQLKNVLFEHLKKEDDKIYEALLNVTKEKNIELVTTTVNTFRTAMKGIAARVINFFNKYPDKEEIVKLSTEFYKDFQAVYENLQKRVDSEEKILFPMYEKYCC